MRPRSSLRVQAGSFVCSCFSLDSPACANTRRRQNPWICKLDLAALFISEYPMNLRANVFPTSLRTVSAEPRRPRIERKQYEQWSYICWPGARHREYRGALVYLCQNLDPWKTFAQIAPFTKKKYDANTDIWMFWGFLSWFSSCSRLMSFSLRVYYDKYIFFWTLIVKFNT